MDIDTSLQILLTSLHEFDGRLEESEEAAMSAYRTLRSKYLSYKIDAFTSPDLLRFTFSLWFITNARPSIVGFVCQMAQPWFLEQAAAKTRTCLDAIAKIMNEEAVVVHFLFRYQSLDDTVVKAFGNLASARQVGLKGFCQHALAAFSQTPPGHSKSCESVTRLALQDMDVWPSDEEAGMTDNTVETDDRDSPDTLVGDSTPPAAIAGCTDCEYLK